MKKEKVFCIVFLALCLLPLLLTAVLGPAAAGGNELLAQPPKVWRDGLNLAFFEDAAAWFDDHFALRQEAITANAAARAAAFSDSAAEDVILGRDGWLYYAATLADYEGTDPMSPRALFCAARSLALLQEYAEGRGMKFLFTAVPNKNSLYPDAMPGRYRQREVESNYDRLLPLLAAENVEFCDLFSAFEDDGRTLYYRMDSHWTAQGSALAHDALMAALGRKTALAEEDFTAGQHAGDLYAMLYPAGKQTETAPVLARAREFSYVGAVRGEDDLRIETACESGKGNLFLFRDSFGNSLHADLAEDFRSAVFSRSMPYDVREIPADADVLMVEIVERNLPWLAEKAPVLLAPVREMELPKAETAAEVSISRKQAGEWTEYRGTLAVPGMDDDSPVYVSLDGTVYEAMPTVSGFTLYAPKAENTAVYVVCGGVLYRCGE